MRHSRALLRRLRSALRASVHTIQTPSPETVRHYAHTDLASTAAPLPSHWFRSASLLDVRGLRIVSAGLPATPQVDDISLSITWGEVIGLVGDDASGAREIAQCIAGTLPAPAHIASGSILFNGVELVEGAPRSPVPLRDTRIAYLARESAGILDPSATVGIQLVALLRTRLGLSKSMAHERSLQLLGHAGIENALRASGSAPRDLSPLMAQRVQIAFALAGNPKLLIADNPTDALNAPERAEILNLLRDLRREFDLTMIIVTRSVAVAALICDRVAVLQDGAIVEYSSVSNLFHSPMHPYTRELLHAEGAHRPGCQAL